MEHLGPESAVSFQALQRWRETWIFFLIPKLWLKCPEYRLVGLHDYSNLGKKLNKTPWLYFRKIVFIRKSNLSPSPPLLSIYIQHVVLFITLFGGYLKWTEYCLFWKIMKSPRTHLLGQQQTNPPASHRHITRLHFMFALFRLKW